MALAPDCETKVEFAVRLLRLAQAETVWLRLVSSTGPEVAAYPVLPLRASALPRAGSAVTMAPPLRVRLLAGRTLSAVPSSFHQSAGLWTWPTLTEAVNCARPPSAAAPGYSTIRPDREVAYSAGKPVP